MNIGLAGTAAGLPAKTIRYYEDSVLICPACAGNGYRHYPDTDVHKLAFLARARSLGFSIEECRQLLSLYVDSHRASADVKRIAQGHLTQIRSQGRRVAGHAQHAVDPGQEMSRQGPPRLSHPGGSVETAGWVNRKTSIPVVFRLRCVNLPYPSGQAAFLRSWGFQFHGMSSSMGLICDQQCVPAPM